MRKLISAALAAAVLSVAAPAAAQVVALAPGEQSDQAIRNLEIAMQDAGRISAISTNVLTDPALATAPTLEALAKLIEPRRPQIHGARMELQAIRSRLLAMPSVSTPSDPVQLRLADQSVRDVGSMAGRVDALMAEMLSLADAVRDGDRASSVRAALAIQAGAVTLMEGQALMLRVQAASLPADGSSFGQLTAMACLSEGVAALQGSLYQTLDRTTAARRIREGRACVVENVALALAAVERERGADLPPSVAELARQMEPLTLQILDELDRGAAVLGASAEAVSRGEGLQMLMPRLTEFQTTMAAIQSITGRQAEVQARQLN